MDEGDILTLTTANALRAMVKEAGSIKSQLTC